MFKFNYKLVKNNTVISSKNIIKIKYINSSFEGHWLLFYLPFQ